MFKKNSLREFLTLNYPSSHLNNTNFVLFEFQGENVKLKFQILVKRKYQLEWKCDCIHRFHSFSDSKCMHHYPSKSSRLGCTALEKIDNFVEWQNLVKIVRSKKKIRFVIFEPYSYSKAILNKIQDVMLLWYVMECT